MDIEIRVPNPDEIEAVSKISAATFVLACPSSSGKDELEKYISSNLSPTIFQKALNSSSIYLISAFANGEMAGFATVLLSSDCSLNSRIVATSEIQKLYVLPKFHGACVAQKLMGAALNHLKNMGIANVWLGVYSNNLRAKRFYSKYGFSVAGETQFKMGSETHLDHIMVASIA
ncbi:N-acetyltransferase [Aurantivibrio infirmus]